MINCYNCKNCYIYERDGYKFHRCKIDNSIVDNIATMGCINHLKGEFRKMELVINKDVKFYKSESNVTLDDGVIRKIRMGVFAKNKKEAYKILTLSLSSKFKIWEILEVKCDRSKKSKERLQTFEEQQRDIVNEEYKYIAHYTYKGER